MGPAPQVGNLHILSLELQGWALLGRPMDQTRNGLAAFGCLDGEVEPMKLTGFNEYRACVPIENGSWTINIHQLFMGFHGIWMIWIGIVTVLGSPTDGWPESKYRPMICTKHEFSCDLTNLVSVKTSKRPDLRMNIHKSELFGLEVGG